MEKKEILLSTAYLPPVEYMAAMVQAENVCMEAHEHYHKQTYRNRCRILSVCGPESMSIPVSKTTPNHCPIREMRISYAENWRRTHWKTLTTCYDTSPYFLYYRDYIEPFYCGKKYDFLFDFNWDLLQTILQLLKASPSIRFNETFEAQPSDCMDFRNIIQPKQLSGKEYPFHNQPAYTQVFVNKQHFCPYLSILDLLCNKGPDSLEYLQNWRWNCAAANVDNELGHS